MANFKKVLAGVLAAAMVLTAAPIASIPAQAANKTVKVKVGKTKKVTFKKNATQKTIKFAKTAQKKIVKVTYNKKTGKVAFKGLKKGTAKVTVKLVVGKKTYKNVYTVKVTKAAATKVAVTGVKLSNSTPKVGDTISATVEPSNATGLTYAWFMGDSATQVETAIDGATTASLAVTDALVGKYVKVVVNGEEGSSASATTTAPVQAAATEKIAIASAKQVGAAKFDVVFNKAISTAEYDITVSRGTTAQTITTVLDDTATKATVTLGTAISNAEYTVKIAKKTDATENAETKVQGEQALLKAIDFVGNELILTDASMRYAAVNIQGVNQFEESVALSGSLTVYSTKGSATYSQADKKITLDAQSGGTATAFFTTGEQVTVTAVYNQGTSILQVAKPLTVSNVATLTKFELGDVATTRASLKNAKLTLTNLGTDTYYFPVKVAEDQYGNKLTAKELDTMMVKASETSGVTAGNLFITPNSADGAFAYVDGFTALEDGTIAMNIKKGNLNSPGKAIFSITGVSGFSGTQELEVLDDPFAAEISVSAPTLYVGEPAELTITAKDQYGNDLNVYDLVGNKVNGKTPGTDTGTMTVGGTATWYFDDFNHLTKGVSSLKFSDAAGALKITTNTSKKTATFTYTPGTKGQNILTLQTASPAVSNLTWTVEEAPTPNAISALKSGVPTTFAAGNKTAYADLSVNTNLVFLNSSGATINTAEMTAAQIADKTVYPQYVTAAPVAGDPVGFYYTVGAPSAACVTNIEGRIYNTTTTGTSNVTATLYQVKTSGGTTAVTKLGEKIFKFTVANAGTYVKYTASLASGSELLYVNKDSADKTAFTVNAIDADEHSIAYTGYEVTVDSGLTVDGQKVLGKNSSISAKGTAIATIWAPVNGAAVNSAVATVEIPYDVAAPAAQKTAQTKDDVATTSTDYTGITGGSLKDGVLKLTNGTNTWKLSVVDQYNMDMSNTTWAIAGKTLTADYTNGTGSTQTYTITATNNKVSGSWTAAIGNGATIAVANTATDSTQITTAALLKTALANAAADTNSNTTITLANDIKLDDQSYVIAAGDTLVIPANVTLELDDSAATADNLKVEGTLVNKGTVTGTASKGVLSGNGTIKESGTIIANAIVTFTGDMEVETAALFKTESEKAAGNGFTTVLTKDATLAANVVTAGKASIKKGVTLKTGGYALTTSAADFTVNGTLEISNAAGSVVNATNDLFINGTLKATIGTLNVANATANNGATIIANGATLTAITNGKFLNGLTQAGESFTIEDAETTFRQTVTYNTTDDDVAARTLTGSVSSPLGGGFATLDIVSGHLRIALDDGDA